MPNLNAAYRTTVIQNNCCVCGREPLSELLSRNAALGQEQLEFVSLSQSGDSILCVPPPAEARIQRGGTLGLGAETLSSVKHSDRKVSSHLSWSFRSHASVPTTGYTDLSLVSEPLPKALKVSLLPAESPWTAAPLSEHIFLCGTLLRVHNSNVK